MKKLILTIGLALTTVGAFAQARFVAQNFLADGVAAIYVTNLVSITNLNTTSALSTNVDGTAWTNFTTGVSAPYTRFVTSTNAASAGSFTNTTKNLLKDVNLWARRDGSLPYLTSATNGFSVPTTSEATVVIRTTGGSGANTALSLVFTPLYGVAMNNNANVLYTPVEGTTADEWTVGITPAGTATVVVTTNVPLNRWPGAAGLRLRRVVNTDSDASGQAIINEISLNGFVPN